MVEPMSNVVPFRGRKAPPQPAGAVDHPLPWHYENGFIWDALGRVVGSTVQKETASWIVSIVNAAIEPDADQA